MEQNKIHFCVGCPFMLPKEEKKYLVMVDN